MLGIVSYPEFLLSRMKADDPLYKPLKKISESGQKAAATVEDLLTLARRGVTTTEVLDFNAVVKEYLQSPEFIKLKSLHTGVRFFSKLDNTLLNLRGSALHLKKTVMNLVSNAAEAIKGRGTVLISTSNCYVDRPIRGYSDVCEGDYILLSVEDDGMGIDPKDIGQIFEPFYTNKIMGRSGTGLGMAVVWGAVQDHHGYIDVQSSPEIGTKIQIYLPITRETNDRKAEEHPQMEIQGHGESILIVDDVADQREIASKILEGLGYVVEAVESGEAALDYLKKNTVALIVLDMIMDPGMDGLETYQAIQAIRPGQKAIIVSGYSETDRVKAAQALGAGAYLKKPYVLETLGMAVRTELDLQGSDALRVPTEIKI
jgi:CheY-like chemotaxis protein